MKNLTMSKRAYTYIAIFFAIILIVSIFAGCGNDTVVNSTGTPPVSNDSLVFNIDSLGIYGTGTQDKDTTIPINNMSDSIKLTFTIESNCDSLAFATGEVGNIAFTISNNFNNSFTYNGKISSNFNGFRVHFVSSIPKYLRFKNIKLYKINPV